MRRASLAAAAADSFRAGGEQWPFDQSFREGGVVATAEAAGEQRPDVAGVLAERMPSQSGSLQLAEPRLVAGQRPCPAARRSVGTAARLGELRRAVREPDGVEVEVVGASTESGGTSAPRCRLSRSVPLAGMGFGFAQTTLLRTSQPRLARASNRRSGASNRLLGGVAVSAAA